MQNMEVTKSINSMTKYVASKTPQLTNINS